jgi:dihydrofolate synthase / folylpolyglutamate synthase
MNTTRTLQDWLTRIEALHPKSIDMGLGRIAPVYKKLNVAPTCPVLIVSGTNGKGSVCAMLESILRCEGYKVGLYTSPHLLRYNERVRVDGDELTDAALVEAFEAVEAARGEASLTFFEFATLAAFVSFSRANLDALVLEVGLGGRLDATNLVDADCAVITSIALDHMDYLGPTREDIAYAKLGVARAGKALVFGEVNPPTNVEAVLQSLDPHATVVPSPQPLSRGERGSLPLAQYLRRSIDYSASAIDATQWTYTGPDGRKMALPYPALRGKFQIHNAATALAALYALKEKLPVRAGSIREGLLTVEWPGRFQVLPGRPTVVLDAAHNPHAAAVLDDALSDMGYHPETIAVFGMLNDKDIDGVIAALKNRVTQWHVVPTHGARGLSAEKVKEKICAAGIPEKAVTCFDVVETAFAAAHKNAAETDRIVVFGSFHILGEAFEVIERNRRARA